MLMSFLAIGIGYLDGRALATRWAILLPYSWFFDKSAESSQNTLQAGKLYNVTMAYDISPNENYEEFSEDAVFQMQWYNKSIEEYAPVRVVDDVSYYYALTPLPQYRRQYGVVYPKLIDRNSAWHYELTVSAFAYNELGEFERYAELDENIDVKQDSWLDIIVIYKMQNFEQVKLRKNVTSGGNIYPSESFPVLECSFMTNKFATLTEKIVFDDDYEANKYAPYMHQEGYWNFKPRTPIREEIRRKMNSGDIIMDMCNLYRCKAQSQTGAGENNSNDFHDCSFVIPPFMGLHVNYYLPDEGPDERLMVGFSILCVVFALLFAAFMFLGISTQKAKSRRVTNKQKNKAVNQYGGGAKGYEGKQ